MTCFLVDFQCCSAIFDHVTSIFYHLVSISNVVSAIIMQFLVPFRKVLERRITRLNCLRELYYKVITNEGFFPKTMSFNFSKR